MTWFDDDDFDDDDDDDDFFLGGGQLIKLDFFGEEKVQRWAIGPNMILRKKLSTAKFQKSSKLTKNKVLASNINEK